MINVRLALRPIRVGFVVKHGDFDALWRAVRFNTCLWGGLYNPIVPVRPADLLSDEEHGYLDAPLPDYLVRAFEVDLIEQLSDDETCKAFVDARGHLTRPHGPGLVYDEGTPNQRLSLLDVQPVLRVLANSGSGRSSWAMPSLPLEGWRANFVRVMCGDADGNEFGATPLRAALGQIRPSEHIVNDSVPLSLHFVTDRWPIHLSAISLERFRPASAWSNPGVFVGDATDFDDLVAFWNLRAAGNALMFLPTQAPRDAMPLARAHAERAARSRPDPWDGPTVWRLRDKHDAVTAAAMEALGVGEHPYDGHLWNGMNIRPVRVAREWDTVLAHLRQTYEESAWVEAQLPQLAFDRSLLRGRNETQQVALDADMTDFTVGGERMTLKVPPLPNMNAFLGRGGDGVRVKRGHVSILQYAEKSVCYLAPVTFRAVMREVLAHSAFKIKDSVPGKYSRRILELMGGVGGCRVLKVPGVRKLLREKAAQTGIGGPNAQQVIADRDPTTKEPSLKELGIYLDGERCTEQIALRHLVKKGVLVPGVALECPKCGERSWYAMTRMRPRVKCECCGATSDTAVRLGTRIDIKFKVAPLWRRVDVQYGVIPVILALWRLEEQHGMGAGRYLTSAEVSGGGLEMEVDFLGLIEEHDERPMLLVGECKNTRERDVAAMKAKVEKLKAWYHAVEKADMKACIAFVTTERDFDADLLKECEAMVKEERRVLLLSARELDPYFAYSGESEDVPYQYAGTMRELCANSQARYLRRRTTGGDATEPAG